ncbi:2-amino-4-hydroxy-6-hydroxymethyldihydropteridine diphosphokinase [Allopusillimonas ginsengisoli]|uniref:2-amino-4-hydroxy-6- hydroxymethyldihydropteridine diphosphokinase n=1 Tax=Allopusillimonas ginsengisoli TaxID=453575 RepID=UPI001021F0F1|nr:2-amino-4-hydroxy-6-hydroxymethyldihydropteridine diphosphokinase [Allopusillimonas ginsengisoli]TEA80080.1 2-amino-4-hydroxy-6-hydroxymethyldihydropteridine diphosphokinase [Allopusillimonas ginsengisoli]
MTRCYIGLGANLGEAQSVLLAAAGQLEDAAGTGTFRLSPLYRSAPVDASGPDYVNAVAEFDTALDAHALLSMLQRIEQAHGRERPYRNAPRTLDLDLLLYGDWHIDDPDLTVPHPRMHQRAFVLRPLADLAPGLKLAQGTLPDLIAACADQAITRIPDDPRR